MAKKGICELCGFADDSYSIEENGNVMKVCKFCHDGYLERMGLPPDADKPLSDVSMTLDLDSADDIDAEQIEENLQMKVEPLTEEELNKVLNGGKIKRRRTVNGEKSESAFKEEIEREEKAAQGKTYVRADSPDKERQNAKRRRDVMEQVNPKSDDERIKITSPEIPLSKDVRPKTNLDVAVSEYKNSVRFMDAFKYVYNQIVYAVFLGLVVATVATVLFIVDTWQHALIVLGGGIAAIGLSYFVMWYLRYRFDMDKRAYLLRIRQQEILFKSMNSDCYRELKTKFTVLKSLSWLLNKLSVVLPLIVIAGSIVATVIVCFLFLTWLMPIILFGAIIAGVFTYWIVKFLADIVTYQLDAERNQQIQQQTLLDMLKVLKK